MYLVAFFLADNLNQNVDNQARDATASDECRICFEPIGGNQLRFAILEHCDHHYCEPCLRLWLQQNQYQPVVCPTCRTESTKVFFQERPLNASGPEKAALFSSMLCCLHDRDANVERERASSPTMREASGSNLLARNRSRTSNGNGSTYYGPPSTLSFRVPQIASLPRTSTRYRVLRTSSANSIFKSNVSLS